MLVRRIVPSVVDRHARSYARAALVTSAPCAARTLVRCLAIGVAALALGCSSSVTGNGVDAAPDVQGDIIDANAATDATDSEPSAVCSNAQTTFDCPRVVADDICARNPPCQVCPQDWLPDGGSDRWMAVQQSLACACPPPMNGAPHPG